MSDQKKSQGIAPRDRVMNLMWNQLHRILTSKDAREQPVLMFEELEPIMEACYEAGQDSVGDEKEFGRRVKFGEWWLTSESASQALWDRRRGETEEAKAKRTAERMNRWSYGCDVRLVLPANTHAPDVVMWAECEGCGQSTQRYPFRQGGAPARAGRQAALATEAAGRLLYVGWVDVSVLVEWEERHMQFVAKSIQAYRQEYKQYHAEHSQTDEGSGVDG